MSDFYTTKLHDKAIIDADSSPPASGSALENMLDGNLDSYWEAQSPTAKVIIIDTGVTDLQVDAFGLWVVNNSNNYSMLVLRLDSSTDKETWGTYDYNGTFGTNNNLVIRDLTTPVEDERYFRITIGTMGIAIKLGHVFLFRKRTFARGPELPDAEPNQFANTLIAQSGNRDLVKAEAQQSVELISKQFRCVTAAEFTVMQTVFDECGGRRRLLAYVEDSDNHLCRLTHDVENYRRIAYTCYDYSIQLKTLPFIKDGENY